jgi:hypothetical protein
MPVRAGFVIDARQREKGGAGLLRQRPLIDEGGSECAPAARF